MEYGPKWPEYAKQWDSMKINPTRLAEFQRYAQFAIKHKDIYKKIEAATGVPWPMIACNHRRESDADFNTYLGNGDPLGRVTTHVPKGRGPFLGPNAFVDGGIDAYRLDGLAAVKDWRLEKMLFWMERFNGSGYDNKGLPSPYIWGGTNIQKPGKYVADHQFNSKIMDTQPGCAPLLRVIADLDPTVKFIRETPMTTRVRDESAPTPERSKAAEAPVTKPLEQSKTIWGGIWQWFAGSGAGIIAAFNGANPWVVALILGGLALGLFLVIKGRVDVQNIMKQMSGES